MTTMQLINMLTLSMDYTTQYLNDSTKCFDNHVVWHVRYYHSCIGS